MPNQTYGVKDPEGPRRFYVRRDALTDDPDENWRVVMRVVAVAFKAGGGEVYMPSAWYRMGPHEEIPTTVEIRVDNEV